LNRFSASKRQAVWFAFGSAFLYAATTPSTKIIVQYMAPIMLAGLLHFGAGIGLSAVWLFQKFIKKETQSNFFPDRKDRLWLVGPILAGGIAASLCLMTAMSITRASCVSLLINLEIVFTVLLAWLIFKEKLTTRAILGLLAIFAGGVCLAGHAELSVSWLSILLMLACCGCWAIDSNFMGQMKNSEPIQIARCRGLCAGTFNFCLALFLGYHLPCLNIIGYAIVTGMIGQGIALCLYILALQQLGVARATAYFSTEPFIGAFLAVLFLREPLGLNLILAVLLMALGVWLHLSEKHEHEYIHTPID
jgi:drug/metabolite transporter (DMT)-like permease